MKNINVCFICDKKYSMPTSVAIQSLVMNSNKKTKYNVYVVGVDLDEQISNIFQKLKSGNVNIFVMNMNNKYESISADHGYVSKAGLLKFDLPNIFSNLDKMLYLDCDMLILKDLKELYNIDLKNKYAAVVKDMAGTLEEGHAKRLKHKDYFNSGMMLLNLKKMREDNLSEKLLDYKLHKDIKHFMDQDSLNYVFKENVIYVSPIYNNMAPNQLNYSDKEISDFYDIKFNLTLDNTVILHLTNYRKVWDYEDVWGRALWMKYYNEYLAKIDEITKWFFKHKVYPNGRHKFYVFGIRVLSYKPRFAPDAKVKGNFLYTKEKCPNGRRHIYICGIKVFSYSKKKKDCKPVVVPVAQQVIQPVEVKHDMVDDYKGIFNKINYNLARENGKIKIWNDDLIIEGEADNTLWTAASVFYNDEYHFDMNEKYIMFDIGFNLGMTSLHKAQDKNCVKIYAFEPFVPTYKLAMRNMELNKKLAKKITAFNYGLGDKDETIDVNYNHDRPGAMSSVKNVFSECDDVEQIHIKNASEILRPLFAKHKENIFLKIDCEGAEKQILPDLEKSGLIKKVDVIVMEWHFEEPTELVDLLLRNNFIVFRLNTVADELGMIRAYRRK